MTSNHTSVGLVERQEGISLFIVIVIGSIILAIAIALAGFALQSVGNSTAREEAVQGSYSAEDAFSCVKYWLGKDVDTFSPDTPAIAGGGADIECQGVSYDWSAVTQTVDGAASNGTTMSYELLGFDFGAGDVDAGKATFTLPGDTRVEVYRQLEDSSDYASFNGLVRVFDRAAAGGSREAERFQQYNYSTISGADFMFLVDRSGSIEGERTAAAETGEWAQLKAALSDGVSYLRGRVPAPYIGIVTFGTGIADTGRRWGNTDVAGLCDTANGILDPCLLGPDVALTDPGDETTLGDLLPWNSDTPGDPTDDVWPSTNRIEVDAAHTNLSLALSIAGLEFSGRFYPIGGTSSDISVAGGSPDYAFGRLEEDVFGDSDIDDMNDYVNQAVLGAAFPTYPRDRPDSDYPDYMIIITDGEPNALISHAAKEWKSESVNPITGNFLATPYDVMYPLGSSKLFRTQDPGSGLFVDTGNDPIGSGSGPHYTFCDDEEGAFNTPSNYVSGLLDGSRPWHFPMCNATKIRDAFFDEGIQIAVIAVGLDNTTPVGSEIEDWLRDWIATDARLYRVADDYADVYDSLREIVEVIILKESR